MSVSLSDAVKIVTQSAPNPQHRDRALTRCDHRILRTDVFAMRDQPPFVSSAMDGYAVADEGPRQSASVFKVVAESRAGHQYAGAVGPGQAVRIFTGAPVPNGSRRVILQEDCQREGDHITVGPEVWEGKTHIRPAASDFARDDLLLKAGEQLDPYKLSLAAGAGLDRLSVAKKPRIVFVTSGDELVVPGRPAGDDQIYESNSVALINLARRWGAKSRFLGIEADKKRQLVRRIAHIQADLIVTIGGASVGDYDLTKPALRELGYVPDFEKVSIRPGKPTSFGRLEDGQLVLGLPGNPASALVCAHLFLKPFIQAALGQISPTPTMIATGEDLAAGGNFDTFLRARFVTGDDGAQLLSPLGDQDSALIQVFARADALIHRPAGAEAAKTGSLVPYLMLDRR
jgi:molybdopterin molybdotransferase